MGNLLRNSLFLLLVQLSTVGGALASSTRIVTADQITSADKTKVYTLPAATDTILGRATTDTLTNKSISGSTNTFSNVPASSITGTLGLSNGGTNATTKAGAFDSLSPMTTSGDIIYGGASGTGTRLGAGSNGQFLTLSSGVPAWGNAPGTTAPTVQSFTSGSGTYTTPTGPSPSYIFVTIVGAGGGGSGSETIGSGNAGNGGAGGDTTFGSLTAGGGFGGTRSAGAPGAGGSVTVGMGIGFGRAGEHGSVGSGYTVAGAAQAVGGNGGSTPFGGGGKGGTFSGTGYAPVANTGSGGGSAGGGTGTIAGGAGGAGGFIRVKVTSPASSYSYGIGSGGSAGVAGTGGSAGNAGSDGFMLVEEFYQ